MNSAKYVLTFALLILVTLDHVAASEPGKIMGRVYCDQNQNGTFDQEDKGLENIHVQIFVGKCGGTALQTVHTNKDGNFVFQGFDQNTYYVRSDVACVCGGRMPTTNTCQKVVLEEGKTVNLPPFGYSNYGQ